MKLLQVLSGASFDETKAIEPERVNEYSDSYEYFSKSPFGRLEETK